MPLEKLPNKLYLQKKTVEQPRTNVDESILHWGS